MHRLSLMKERATGNWSLLCPGERRWLRERERERLALSNTVCFCDYLFHHDKAILDRLWCCGLHIYIGYRSGRWNDLDSLYTVPARPIADVPGGARKMVHNKWEDHNLWYENTSHPIYTDSEQHDNTRYRYNLILMKVLFSKVLLFNKHIQFSFVVFCYTMELRWLNPLFQSNVHGHQKMPFSG